MIKKQILKILPIRFREYFEDSGVVFNNINEIRIRINRPVTYLSDNYETFTPFTANGFDLEEIMEYVSSYSVYAFEDEIRNGFITVEGGHRVGICGRVISENSNVKSIRNINFINIRIAHEIVGCSDGIIDKIFDEYGARHTMIIAPPGYGKTTLLRDIIRNISNGTDRHSGVNVSVVDERSEIAACHLGVPQNDLGIRTDVMDCCPKIVGMLGMIRTMSPKVIAVDEIGNKNDVDAIMYVINCGCKVVCTVHGKSYKDVSERVYMKEPIEMKIFERYLLIDKERMPYVHMIPEKAV